MKFLMSSEFQEADVIASKSNIKLGSKFCEMLAYFYIGESSRPGFYLADEVLQTFLHNSADYLKVTAELNGRFQSFPGYISEWW